MPKKFLAIIAAEWFSGRGLTNRVDGKFKSALYVKDCRWAGLPASLGAVVAANMKAVVPQPLNEVGNL